MKSLVLLFVIVCCVAQDEDLTCTETYCTDYKGSYGCSDLPESCQIQNSTHSGLILLFPGPCNCCDYCLRHIAEGEACAVGSPSSPTPTSICGDGLSCDPETLTCQRMDTECTRAQDEYDNKRNLGTLGYMEVRPSCDRNGLYEPYNCIPGQTCYCLSEEGERIFGEIEYSDNVASILNCKCSRNYFKAVELIGSQLNPDQHFRCQSNGDYDEVQCIGTACYCVDPTDGSPATSTMTAVNISMISETLSCFDEDVHVTNYYRECEESYLQKLEEIKQLNEAGYEVIGYTLPNCQLDGYYGAVQSNSTSKYCAYPNGTVIDDFILDKNDELAATMNCKCARARSLITSEERPTCCQNGNYESVQCRRGLCRCVDANGVQIEQEVSTSNSENLSCYSDQCTV